MDAALQGGVKLPAATTRDPSRAQIGEGQVDLELLASVGKRGLPGGAGSSVWGSVDAGYHWRRRNDDTGLKPGDEWLYRFELGYQVSGRLFLATQLGGFDGAPGQARAFGLTLPAMTQRRSASVSPSLSYRLGPSWQVVLSANLPLAGQRSYAGRQFAIGLAYDRSRLLRLEGGGGASNPRGTGCCQIQ